jgi:ABC-type nitrate/sulfonate/bicarbonate transport system permease component
MKSFKEFFPALLIILGLLFIWEAYARSGFISGSVLPAPSHILQALIAQRRVIMGHTLQTASEALIGLSIAVVLGIFFGTIIFLSSKLRKALYPLLVVSQTIPLIALAPLLLIWFGFDLLPKVVIVVLYCFFPITVAVSDGLVNADSHLVDLLKSMKASRWQTLQYVQMPAALPAFFSGLKISATYAITGAIVGEYVGAYKGLGIYMQSAAHSDAIDLVFASILVIIVLSLILLSFVIVVGKLCMPWRGEAN